MFCRAASLLLCICVAAAAATDYSGPVHTTESSVTAALQEAGEANGDEPGALENDPGALETAELLRKLSKLWRLVRSAPAPADNGTQQDGGHSGSTQTPPVAAACPTLSPDDEAVRRLRCLPGEEKDRRLLVAANEGAVDELHRLLVAAADVEVKESFMFTPLHVAVRYGHMNATRCLLAHGAEVNATSTFLHFTPLHVASVTNQTELVHLLLQSRANPDARTDLGLTPLHLVAGTGNVRAATLLLESGAEVDGSTSFQQLTPLHVASLWGQTAVVQLLLSSSANPNARSDLGVTPLHLVAGFGHVQVATLLLENGAEVDARTTWLRLTPLHVALFSGQAAVVRLLLSSSADPNARTDGGLTPLHLVAAFGRVDLATVLLEAGADKWATTDDGKTPLYFARQKNSRRLINILSAPESGDNGTSTTTRPPTNCSQTRVAATRTNTACPLPSPNHYRVSRLRCLPDDEKDSLLLEAAKGGQRYELQRLLAAGADAGARDWFGRSALLWAAYKLNFGTVRCLLAHGAPVNVSTTYLHITPLHAAAANNVTELVNTLLLSQANPNARTDLGLSPLHLVAGTGNVRAAALLLESGAEVDARTTWLQLTPLHVASLAGHTAVVQLLLTWSANPNARSELGLTPLHLVGIRGHVGAATVLLEHGAEVDARATWLQLTPLHVALFALRDATVRLLLSSSADPNARTAGGLTPLHLVAATAHQDLATVLLEAGADRWATTDDGKTPLYFARLNNQTQMINILSAPAPAANGTQPHGRLGDRSRTHVDSTCPTPSPDGEVVHRLR